MFLFALMLVVSETFTVLKGGREKTVIFFELGVSAVMFVLAFTGFCFVTDQWRKTPSAAKGMRTRRYDRFLSAVSYDFQITAVS